jgi:polyvinyl alcohol dehydrogenase (cytochrome)
MKRQMAFAVLSLITSTAAVRGETWPYENWPMYGKDLSHTFSNPITQINRGNVGSLMPAWTFPTGDAVSASPAVVDGVVYVGSWDGFFYAIDATTGQLRWKVQLDCQPSVVPVPQVCGGPAPGTATPSRFQTPGGIVTSSAAVVDGHVYFGGGRTLYSLAADDGHLIWKHLICGNPDDQNCTSDQNDPLQILSSPAVFAGTIYVGVTTGGVNFGIPYRGGFLAFDAQTGEQRWRFEVDPEAGANSTLNRGCGNVWSSPALDPESQMVFFGTADCEEQPLPPYHGSVLALDARTGHLAWVFRARETDPYKCDFDFGASPNLVALGEQRAVGIGGKDGTYYLLDRTTGQKLWATRVVFGGDSGGFFGGAAFDGRRLFSATAFGDGNVLTQTGLCDPAYRDPSNPNIIDTYIQDPSMHSLGVSNGRILHEQNDNESFGATTLGDHVVFAGFIGLSEANIPSVKAYDSATLAQLSVLSSNVGGSPGMVNSAAIPIGRMLFFGSGNYFDGTGGGVHAYVLPDGK